MGTDKAFLLLDGKPLIEHVLSAVRTVCRSVIIVTNAPDRYERYDAVVIPDVFVLRGPLSGIHAGLLRSDEDYNFVAACDMPFLNPALIRYLRSQAEGYDVTVPEMAGLVEPLHAIYRRHLVAVIEQRLHEGRKDIRGLFSETKVRFVPEEEIVPIDQQCRSFRNLNTKQEYEEAVCSDWECRNL